MSALENEEEASEYDAVGNTESDKPTEKSDCGEAEKLAGTTAPETVPRSEYEQLLGRLGALEKKISKFDDSVHNRDLDSDDDQYSGDVQGPWLDLKSLHDIRFMIRSARSARKHHKLQIEANKAANKAITENLNSHLTVEKIEGDRGLSAVQLLQEGIKVVPNYATWLDFERKTLPNRAPQVRPLLEPIHVLVGEPNIIQPLDFNGPAAEEVEIHHPSIESLNERLPERIHISSFHLVQRLVVLLEMNVGFNANGFVLLRPFKSLVYFEHDLRKTQSDLRESISTRVQAGASVLPFKIDPSRDSSATEEHSDLLKDAAILLQLDCLLEFFDAVIKPKLHEFKDNNYHEEIAFDELWNLFKPGDLVLEQGEKQAYRLIRVVTPAHRGTSPWARWFKDEDTSDSDSNSGDESDGDPLRLECVFLDYDGVQFGPVSRSFKVPRYEGKKPIKSLPVYGLRFSQNPNIQQQLIQRGKVLIDVATYKSMYYTGFSLDAHEEIDSQVVVDFAEALSVPENEDWKPDISPASTATKRRSRGCRQVCCAGRWVPNDDYIDRKLVETFMQTLMPQQTDKPPITLHPKSWDEMKKDGYTPNDDELLIMTHRVFAFVLRSRKWGKPLSINAQSLP